MVGGDSRSALLDGRPQVGEGLLQSRVAVHWRAWLLGRIGHAGILEEVFEQHLHALCPLDEVRNKLIGVAVQAALIPFLQQLAVDDHHAQGLLQVVRDRVGELVEVLVGVTEGLVRLPQRRVDLL